MCLRPIPLSGLVLCAVVLAGCGQLSEQVEQVRERGDHLSDRSRFCLTLTRTLAAIESRSPDTAAEAAEELLGQVPGELDHAVADVVDELRAVQADEHRSLEDPRLHEVATDLTTSTREHCDPTAGAPLRTGV